MIAPPNVWEQRKCGIGPNSTQVSITNRRMVSACQSHRLVISLPVVGILQARAMSVDRIQHRVGIVAVIVLTFALLTPGTLWSWGRIGHRVSARIAEARLTPAALAAVNDLLSGLSLEDVADWADGQRLIRGTSTWHYVNIPITEPRYDHRFCTAGGCVVGRIEDFRQVLLNPKDEGLH